MKSVSIRIDDDMKARWDRLAADHGLNPSQLMRQAIAEKLEELEDFYTVRSRLDERFDPIADKDVWKALGL